MESHPVPQNVTAFEFHLVGNMTLRQFGYLAIGLTIAYVSFLLFFEALPLLAWPLIIIPSVVGTAYAFLPIMERPLDYWTKAFIKAIRRPTLRKYNSKTIFADDPKFKDRLEIYLHFLQTLPRAKLDIPTQLKLHTPIVPLEEKTAHPPPPSTPPTAANPPDQPQDHDTISEFISNLNKLSTPTGQPAASFPRPTTPPPPSVTPSEPPAPNPPPEPEQVVAENLTPAPLPEPVHSEEELDKTVALAKQAQLIQSRILVAEKQINDIKTGAVTQRMDPKKYTEQFQAVLSDLQKLNQRARDISHELAELSKTPTTTISAQPASKPNIIPSLTLTSTANIINGIITDAQGNYIEGAIIVAHDKAGLPVRALKTNKLGQFIAATPLPSGTFTISVEKDDLSFDVIQVELEDKVLNPIVISAKKGATPA